MTTTEDFFEFEGDFCQDTVTYRLIELSEAALTTAFEEDEQLGEKYFFWLEEKCAKEEEGREKKPILLYEFSLEKEERVQIFALPNRNEFFIRFKTDFFQASVLISYEIDKMNIELARVVMFSGKPLLALSWAESLHASWDDLLFDLMRLKGERG